MERYRDEHGDSGVAEYETGPDFIKVRFKGPTVYVYTYASAGALQVERMKELALRGRGLSTFISQHVRDRYERKE